MSQMSFFDAKYADKRKRTRLRAVRAQIEPRHPETDNKRMSHPIKTDTAYLSDVAHEHRLGAVAVGALSNLWTARQWFALAGEVRL